MIPKTFAPKLGVQPFAIMKASRPDAAAEGRAGTRPITGTAGTAGPADQALTSEQPHPCDIDSGTMKFQIPGNPARVRPPMRNAVILCAQVTI